MVASCWGWQSRNHHSIEEPMAARRRKKAAKRKAAKRKATKRKGARTKKASRKKATRRKATKRKGARRKTAKRKATKRKKARKTARKKTAKRKTAKRKTAKRKAKKRTKRKPSAAFMKPMQPDAALAAVVGNRSIPRTEVTKRIWAYIRRRGLQDAKNRRMINADDNLRRVFNGRGQVSMFEMTKLVNRHLS